MPVKEGSQVFTWSCTMFTWKKALRSRMLASLSNDTLLAPSCSVRENEGVRLLVNTVDQGPSRLKVAVTGPVMPVFTEPSSSVRKVCPLMLTSAWAIGLFTAAT